MRAASTCAAAVVLGLALTGCAAWADGDPEAVVSRVIDGDTLQVELDGRPERVRLLYVDAPGFTEPVECLAVEAADHLQSLTPHGSVVTLQYDEQRRDDAGDVRAAVRTEDGVLINAEMARAGLAELAETPDAPVLGPVFDEVREAGAEAAAAGFGLHSDACEASIWEELTPRLSAAGTAISDAWSGIEWPEVELPEFEAPTPDEDESGDELSWWSGVWAGVEERWQEQEAAREEAEEQRGAEQRRQAQAEQERRESERIHQQSEDDSPPPAPGQPTADDEPARTGPHPGYTGPRCYEPGGVVWHPC